MTNIRLQTNQPTSTDQSAFYLYIRQRRSKCRHGNFSCKHAYFSSYISFL